MSTKDAELDEFKPKYKQALKAHKPFVFAPESSFEDGLDVKDYSKEEGTVLLDYLDPEIGEIEAEWIDPYADESAAFMEMLLEVDKEAYDAELTMEHWVILDAAVLPGGVVGFGKYPDQLDEETLNLLDVPDDYDGVVPLTESAGAFTVDGDVLGHTFATLHQGEGLGMLSSILRAEVYPQDTWKGVIQWDNVTQMVYSKLGEMTIDTPTLPPHSLPDSSLVYTLELDKENLAKPLKQDLSEPYDHAVGADDDELLQYIEDSLDEHEFKIVPPGAVFEEGEPHVTVKEV